MIIKNIKNKIEEIKNIKNKNSGFTLVEALTAIFVLTFVVVGLMTVVSDSLFATKYARDEITANFLLQETIDFVRNDRDTSVFLNTSSDINTAWDSFYAKYEAVGCNNTSTGCTLNANVSSGSNIFSCTVDACRYLYLEDPEGDKDNSNNSFYITRDHPSWTSAKPRTNFRRTLKVVKQGVDNNQLVVTAKVYWKNGNLNKSRTLTTTLSKWQ